MPKSHPKICTNPPNSGYGYKHRDSERCLKRERDIGKKAALSLHVYPTSRVAA